MARRTLADVIQEDFIDKGQAGAAALMVYILLFISAAIVVITLLAFALAPKTNICYIDGVEQVLSKSRNEMAWIRRDGALVTETYTYDSPFAKFPNTSVVIVPGDRCPAAKDLRG